MFSIFDPARATHIPNWVFILSMLRLGYITTVLNNLSYLVFKINKSLITEIASILPANTYVYSRLIILFVNISVINFIGLLPYVIAVTGHLSVTLPLSLLCWFRINGYGWINKFSRSLSHLVPLGCPYVLIPLITIIELIRSLIRPITLSVRLAANITAGHLILVLISGGRKGVSIISLSVLLGDASIRILEVGVALIQPYVFFILVVLYTQEIL